MAINAKSKIEWTDATMNVLAGCKACDAGCLQCYAERDATRLAGNPNEKIRRKYLPTIQNGSWSGKITVTEKEFEAPLRKQKPLEIFVNSMSDLFYPEVKEETIDRHFLTFFLADWHKYQVLTKRARRMREYINTMLDWERLKKQTDWMIQTFNLNGDKVLAKFAAAKTDFVWMPNVILGVSISDQRGLTLRYNELISTMGFNRMLSLEPLVEAVKLPNHSSTALVPDWVVVGGESTRLNSETPRPMAKSWVTDLKHWCGINKVPFFFKQWGEFLPTTEIKTQLQIEMVGRPKVVEWECETASPVEVHYRVGKHIAGRELNGETWNDKPELVTGEFINYYSKK